MFVIRVSAASMEDRGLGPLDDLSFSEQTFPPQDAAGLRYSALISGEINRDGKAHMSYVVTTQLYELVIY